MDQLNINFNSLNIDGLSLTSLINIIDDIENDIDIYTTAINNVIEWIDKNPHHTFPKWKKTWLNCISGNKHLNNVRVYDNDNFEMIKIYIDREKLFNQLINREYLIIDKRRIRLNSINKRLLLGYNRNNKRRRIN